LCRLRRRLYCGRNSPKIRVVCVLQTKQFWYKWHSALGAAMLCIWGDMEENVHCKLLERNLIVTAERYCQQFRRMEKAI
jgi:hypothetical protein